MFKFNKQLAALTLLTVTSIAGTMLTVTKASADQTVQGAKSEYVSNKSTKFTYRVLITAPNGAVIRSGAGSNFKKIGTIAYQKRIKVTRESADGNWVKLAGRPGWVEKIHLAVAE